MRVELGPNMKGVLNSTDPSFVSQPGVGFRGTLTDSLELKDSDAKCD